MSFVKFGSISAIISPNIFLASTSFSFPSDTSVAQMKEQMTTPGKELSDQEIDNRPYAEFKTLVIRMLTEVIESGHKIKEEVKAIQSEIKIFREPTVKGRKLGFKSTIWNKRKK